MDSKVELYLKRSKNEINIANLLFNLSKNKLLEDFDISSEETFYSAVISHSYYSIFYCAKAMLFTKNIDTKAPEVHKKTLEQFNQSFIESGILDVKLLLIYKEMIIRADELLEIFKTEKNKRGKFTYFTIPQANYSPAKESIENSKTFFSHCNTFLLYN